MQLKQYTAQLEEMERYKGRSPEHIFVAHVLNSPKIHSPISELPLHFFMFSSRFPPIQRVKVNYTDTTDPKSEY